MSEAATTEILMPRLSDSMEEGLLLQWLKAEGDEISPGDELVEIETDKATMVYEAEAGGVLQIVAAEGSTVAVGDVIARVGAADAVSSNGDGAVGAVSPERRAGAEAVVQAQTADKPAIGKLERSGDPAPTTLPQPGNPVTPATPVARRVAGAHGIALEDLQGSGPRGRITKTDVLAAAGIAVEEPPKPAPAPVAGNGSGTRELSRLQRLIAQRMSEAKSTIPHFQVQTEVVMDRAIGLRTELKELTAEGEPAPSFNDLIVKASAAALRIHPQANGSYAGDTFTLHERVNVGVAVASEGALVVPTVFDADTKSVGQIARETRALAERVRSGEITPAELEGGTFTVSNLGMYGMTAITPVINPPQAAILGVGAIREVLAREDGEIVDRSLLTLTLSCDHRILYGADASLFLAEIKALLESPLRLTL
jgi:pyruvate dehydrogenase E2 component (dihydrolipoyllysine-residue acetyltransferase)